MSEKYNDLDELKNLENLKNYSESIPTSCKYLDAGQLIKHTLGLKKVYGKNFTLFYLWYDVLGEEGAEHRREIQKFSNVMKMDGIKFKSISYQKCKYYLNNLKKVDPENLDKKEKYKYKLHIS